MATSFLWLALRYRDIHCKYHEVFFATLRQPSSFGLVWGRGTEPLAWVAYTRL